MIVIVLALAGPALAVGGFVFAIAGASCACPECKAFWRVGWRAILYGLALVVAAWLIGPWPPWLIW